MQQAMSKQNLGPTNLLKSRDRARIEDHLKQWKLVTVVEQLAYSSHHNDI